MAQTPDDLNEDSLKEPEDSSAGLTQDALDALFASTNMDEVSGGQDWTEDASEEESDGGDGSGFTDAGFNSNAALSDSDVADLFASMSAANPSPAAAPPPSMRPATIDLPSFDTGGGHGAVSGGGDGYQRVRDIPLDVTVELGRTQLLIRDILDLSTGSIIELDKIAGEPVELYANGLLVARGEVIVIDDNFGVRVTEIITAAARGAAKEQDILAA
ncbi:MAG: CheC, phosphatase, inhibitor of methylation / FliN fusion protein [Capsulimonas sp.]|nr:CheC, phosphatase, inhibitor of methylation / FliN fusion protein [Capsulimonas sp.]